MGAKERCRIVPKWKENVRVRLRQM